jgi:ABC-type polar amino acid transport system ATPase subunit
MTSVVVAHEMYFARRVADQIVYRDHGKVVENSSLAKSLTVLKDFWNKYSNTNGSITQL